MRQRVVKALKPLDAFSVENPCRPGTPDVNYMEGWMELKHKYEWPKRAATTVRLDHFTPQQRLCLMKRWHAGGNSFLLLQVGDDWLLFDGDVAAEKVGRVNKEELYIIAKVTWFRPELKDVLAEQLSR